VDITKIGSAPNPISNYETGFPYSVHSVATDNSPSNSNQEGSGSRPQSNHPTPSTLSNQASSHTSYTSPPNPSTGGNNNSSAQSQHSPSYLFSGASFNMNMSNLGGQGTSPQQQNLNFGSTGLTPGPTGMTPMADGMWPPEGIPEGNEWMFSWPGSTPQPQ
jgi:hypothetical protein